jgi:hypothetical protein
MPPVGFEPTISVLERTKTVHALDGEVTVIDIQSLSTINYSEGYSKLTLVFPWRQDAHFIKHGVRPNRSAHIQ